LYAYGETSRFKQSGPTLVSPVSSIGLETITFYITPTMVLYENMKPIEHVLLHLICVLFYLICQHA